MIESPKLYQRSIEGTLFEVEITLSQLIEQSLIGSLIFALFWVPEGCDIDDVMRERKLVGTHKVGVGTYGADQTVLSEPDGTCLYIFAMIDGRLCVSEDTNRVPLHRQRDSVVYFVPTEDEYYLPFGYPLLQFIQQYTGR